MESKHGLGFTVEGTLGGDLSLEFPLYISSIDYSFTMDAWMLKCHIHTISPTRWWLAKERKLTIRMSGCSDNPLLSPISFFPGNAPPTPAHTKKKKPYLRPSSVLCVHAYVFVHIGGRYLSMNECMQVYFNLIIKIMSGWWRAGCLCP